MTFTDPLILLALVPVAALALAYVLLQRRRTRYAVRFATLPMLDRVAPARPRWRRHLATGLVLLALGAFATAAAGPEMRLRVPYERATVIVAIDVSGSMEAQDVPPDRLTAAKGAAVRFVRELPETVQVGVVAFAEEAELVAPVTADRVLVENAIEGLEAGGGTAIGEAVFASAEEVVRQAAANSESSDRDPSDGGSSAPGDDGGDTRPDELIPARLVLLSDGFNTVGRSPADSVPAALDAQMPVSTIAYGTPDGVIGNGFRTQSAPADDDSLRLIAEETGGHFYSAESGAELDQVYEDIGSAIGWRTETTLVTTPLVLLGLALAITATALSLRWFSRLV
ncbi:Ca-activated chloride channel family protein [Promicromonospora umidemergens]|uniref:VWFA domain-containing protein n=1 Tax=Promicromonospora umidemergens TaxID=629679 RepID=A0ABP8WQM5_9MICO|nr:VWA domain-containing protein [Promicromonospora umidemergens]MCP2283391.1 Ca-activated chloride channel family protein [Promicromonospora umidemergens]